MFIPDVKVVLTSVGTSTTAHSDLITLIRNRYEIRIESIKKKLQSHNLLINLLDYNYIYYIIYLIIIKSYYLYILLSCISIILYIIYYHVYLLSYISCYLSYYYIIYL